MANQCGQCGNPANLRCSQCRTIYYCSQECQRKNWKKHKNRCKDISGKISINDIWKCMDRALNPLVKYFGPDVMYALSHKIKEISQDGPIVSVGSGHGYIEGFMRYVSGIDIICIDPNPSSYQAVPPMNPKYSKSVNKIVENMRTAPLFDNIEHYREKCSTDPRAAETLIINWPSPNQTIPWDIQAIKLLGAETVIIFFEMFGGSGSMELTSWLSTFTEIYTPLEQEIHKSLNSIKGFPSDAEPMYDGYYVNEIIKGHNGDEVEIPENFMNLPKSEKKYVSIDVTKTSYTYAIVILSRTYRTPTLRFDPSKFKHSYMSDNHRMQLKIMEMLSCRMVAE
jgi:hypothetical protein